jgi:hypothetical protein
MAALPCAQFEIYCLRSNHILSMQSSRQHHWTSERPRSRIDDIKNLRLSSLSFGLASALSLCPPSPFIEIPKTSSTDFPPPNSSKPMAPLQRKRLFTITNIAPSNHFINHIPWYPPSLRTSITMPLGMSSCRGTLVSSTSPPLGIPSFRHSLFPIHLSEDSMASHLYTIRPS